MPAFVDITGERYGRLIANRCVGRKWGKALWSCVCDCGSVTEVASNSLRSGVTQSCGCLSDEARRINGLKTDGRPPIHGLSKIPEYFVWKTMRQRACGKGPKKDRKHYAGITCCDRWSRFENFIADMGRRPPGMSIDRIDNSKGYEPKNCRWATATEQRLNQRPRTSRRMSIQSTENQPC